MITIIKRLFFIVICILVLLVVLHNVWLKAAIEGGIFAVTGAPLKIKHLNVKLFQPEVDIKGMTIYNPKGFPDKVMGEIAEIYVKYDPSDVLFKGIMHFNEIRIKLDELTVVHSKKAELNINALKALQPKGEGPPPKFQIDLLELEIGKVVYKDYAVDPGPLIREFPIQINEKYSNITSPQDLVKLIVLRALSKTSVASLANFDINQLKNSLSSAIEAVGQNMIQKIFDTLGQDIQQLPFSK